MTYIFNLPLTTAEAHDLKNFIKIHTKSLIGKIELTDYERCIAFIADRIPDVQPGQQTFTTETKDTSAPQKPEKVSILGLFSLCLDIIKTASPSTIKKYAKFSSLEYLIIDPATKDPILSVKRYRPIYAKETIEYNVDLYDSTLPMSHPLKEEMFNTLFEVCEKIIAEKDREKEKSEQEKRSERLAASIQKAHQYISSHKS